VKDRGATMRLGSHTIVVQAGSHAHALYEKTTLRERHRHRFEVNGAYVERFEAAGLRFSGRSQDERRMEIAELADHPYFVAVQFHPEFLSRPNRPHPLFKGLVQACLDRCAPSCGC